MREAADGLAQAKIDRPYKQNPTIKNLYADPVCLSFNGSCADYITRLEAAGIQPSMSRGGCPYDNAMAESFMKTLKHEDFRLASSRSRLGRSTWCATHDLQQQGSDHSRQG